MGHNIVSAKFMDDEGHYVEALMADGSVRTRYITDDISGGGMKAFLAEGGTVQPYVAPGPTADDVREEASRRMQVAVGARSKEHLSIEISNINREAIRFLNKAIMQPQDRTRKAELEALDSVIEDIRGFSNVLEVMNPIPSNFKDDQFWS